MRGHVEVVRALLEGGADRGMKNAQARHHGGSFKRHRACCRQPCLENLSVPFTCPIAQDCLPVDLCQPQWSLSWRYTRELFQGPAGVSGSKRMAAGNLAVVKSG